MTPLKHCLNWGSLKGEPFTFLPSGIGPSPHDIRCLLAMICPYTRIADT